MSGDEGDGEVFNPWKYVLTSAQAMFAQWCADKGETPIGNNEAFDAFWEGLSSELQRALYTCDKYYKVSQGQYAKKHGSEQYAYVDGTSVNAVEPSESITSSGRKAAFKRWATAISVEKWTRFKDNYKSHALSAVVDDCPANSNQILYYRNLLRAMNAAEDDSDFTFTLPYVYTSQTNIILTLRVDAESTLSFNEEIYDIGRIDDAAQIQLEQTLTVYRAEQLNTTTSVDNSEQSAKNEIAELRRVVDNLRGAIQTFENRKAMERQRLDDIETAIDASTLSNDQNTSVVMRHIKRLASGPLVESRTQIGELFQAVASLSAKVDAADSFPGKLQLERQIRALQQGFTGILDEVAEERQTYSAVTASIRELQTGHANMRRLFRDIGELDFETKLEEMKRYAELTKQTALRNTDWIEGLRGRVEELLSALQRDSEKLSTTAANATAAKLSLAEELEQKRLQLSAVTYVSESGITSAADLSRNVDAQISDLSFIADSEPSRAAINVRFNAAGHANVYDLALQFGAFYVLADAAARARLQPLPGENPLMHVAHVYWSVVPIQRGWHEANDIYNALFDGSGNVLRGAQPGPPAAGFKMADIQGFGAENEPLKPGSAYPMMVWSPRLGRPVLAAKTATGVPFYDALSMRGNHAAVGAALGAAFAEGGPRGAFDAALEREIDVLPPLNPVFENSFVMAVRAGSRVEPLMVPEFALRPHCIAHNAALEEAFTFEDIDVLNGVIRARFEAYPHYSPDAPGAAVGVGSLPPLSSPVPVALSPSVASSQSVSSTPLSADGPAPAFQLSPVVPTGNSLSPSQSPGGGGITADASVSLTNVSATSGPALPPLFPIDDLVLLPPDLQLGVEVKIIVRGVSGDSESSILRNAENTLESIGQNVLGGVSDEEALAFRETLTKHKIGGFAFEYPGDQGPPVDYKTYLRIAYETVRLTSTAKLGVWGMHHVKNWGCFVFPGLQIGVGIVLKDGTVFGPDGRLYKNSRRRWTNDKLWQYDKKNFRYLKGNNAARLKTGLFETYKRVLHEVTGQKTLTTATLVLLKPDFDTPDSADSIAVFVAMGETELFWVAQNNTETLNTWSATDIHAADEIPWLCDITPDTNTIQDVFTESNKKIRDAGDVFPTFSSTAAPAASDDAVL